MSRKISLDMVFYVKIHDLLWYPFKQWENCARHDEVPSQSYQVAERMVMMTVTVARESL